MNKRLTWLWFAIGVGAGIRLVASLTLTEAIVLVVAPFVVFNEYPYMKRSGALPFWLLSLMMFLGCAIACAVNGTPRFLALRGFAATSVIMCAIPFAHSLIRNDPNGFRWMLLGNLCLAVFHFVTKSGIDVLLAESADAYSIKGLVFTIAMMPVKGWYLKIPTEFSVGASLFIAMFSLTRTVSGRGTALGCLGFAVLAFIGGRTPRDMSWFSRHFRIFCIVCFLAVSVLNTAYRHAAMKGWLGERSRSKYYMQTQGSKSVGRLLLGGRGEAFVGLLGCRDRPIVGFGPWAMDTRGYIEEFVNKYGTERDIDNFYNESERNASKYNGYRLIPCHSHITECWLWFGISGLLFWVYYVFIVLRYLKEDCFAVPQWFGWLACSIPEILWNIVFNPMSSRFLYPMIGVAFLYARAVRMGTFVLPPDMINEMVLVGQGKNKRWH